MQPLRAFALLLTTAMPTAATGAAGSEPPCVSSSCQLQPKATFAAMQPVSVGPAATAQECCARLQASNAPGGRCNQSGFGLCKYFRWKGCPGICSPFPQCLGSPPKCPKACPFCTNNCELHRAAGPYLRPDADTNTSTVGWLPGTPPPKDSLPVDKIVAAVYQLSAEEGLGLQWEGVGAISGGGATSKLLMDYDAAVASDILDYLFTPSFGLSLQILKVEVGGDTDATEGAESSHMHSESDLNFDRGYGTRTRTR